MALGELRGINLQSEADLTRAIGDIAGGRYGLPEEARGRITQEVENYISGMGSAQRGIEERFAIKGREMTPGMEMKMAQSRQAGIGAVRSGAYAGEYSRAMQGISMVSSHIQQEQKMAIQRAALEAQLAYQKKADAERKKWQNIQLVMSALGLGAGVFGGYMGYAGAMGGAKIGAGWIPGQSGELVSPGAVGGSSGF